MKLRREIEIKLRVRERGELKRRLKELGFRRITPRLYEQNSLFDFADRRLLHHRQALRLRTSGGLHFITFKGSPSTEGGYKSRDEIETSLGSTSELRRILTRLGMTEVLRYNKFRTTYLPAGLRKQAGAAHPFLVFDETSAGDFIELEGSRSWIDRVASQLGYGPESYITESYVTMLGAARGVRGKRGEKT
ncbi:MAG: class IV adenylate cyclase [Acidobacteriota bacterium]|nr:class IV adenylate cyclase [Acidobacteriota bacterium]